MAKILVVDDKREVRELLGKTLARRGYEIIGAEDGRQALRLARSEKPDLILMDILMPGPLSGTEATRILKSTPETKSCKIMILTGKDEAAEEATEAGADACFSKPFSPLELLQRLDELLDERSQDG